MSGRRSPWSGAVALGATVVVGAWLVQDGTHGTLPPAPSPAQALADGAIHPAALSGTPMARSVPVRISIPAIGLNAPVTGVGLDGASHLATPPDHERNLAGWYQDGVTPGQRGTALLVGHVDTAAGPAVFYGLGALRRGERIDVVRADGGTAWFVVDAIDVYDKSAFPDHRVYGRAPDAQLRLITCGGGFSKGRGYQGNVVVYAHLTGHRGVA
ncbi:sortase (surface protein transpeptidase) [Kitasatospora sp. GAS204A]|uniref:class F sortase n=1 Tax=unclassified Kitasatospora TaxID=2633591 RepID=UPI0024736A5E|nr:class F sortase [Kitasatospora sp. GAS204B]MDH6121494.1 sortase (surface protein transpeptidase) [Kitasatospora sp. GAS204B]